jgi:DNA polymerase-3 subunit epsilon
MLVSRRVYPDAPSHRLGTLVEYKGIPACGTFHRALADAEMTAHLWLRMLDDLTERHRIETIPFTLMQGLSKVPKARAADYLRRWRSG